MQYEALKKLNVRFWDRNLIMSYSFCPPGQTGSQSDAHRPIYGPGCEERPLHPGHLQTCCIVKAFCFDIWTEKTAHMHNLRKERKGGCNTG